MYKFLTDNFGLDVEIAQIIQYFASIAIILLAIGLLFWLIKRFRYGGFGKSDRRKPRLAVMDSTSIDQKRRLVLIRRDNVEHLLLIGGPGDLVVEPNIVRGTKLVSDRQDVSAMATSAPHEKDGDMPAAPPLRQPGSRPSTQMSALKTAWPDSRKSNQPPFKPATPNALGEQEGKNAPMAKTGPRAPAAISLGDRLRNIGFGKSASTETARPGSPQTEDDSETIRSIGKEMSKLIDETRRN